MARIDPQGVCAGAQINVAVMIDDQIRVFTCIVCHAFAPGHRALEQFPEHWQHDYVFRVQWTLAAITQVRGLRDVHYVPASALRTPPEPFVDAPSLPARLLDHDRFAIRMLRRRTA